MIADAGQGGQAAQEPAPVKQPVRAEEVSIGGWTIGAVDTNRTKSQEPKKTTWKQDGAKWFKAESEYYGQIPNNSYH